MKLTAVFTNKYKKAGKTNFYYNIVLKMRNGGNKYSITTNALFINTRDETIYLSNDFDYDVYSFESGENLPEKRAAKFIQSLIDNEEGNTLQNILVNIHEGEEYQPKGKGKGYNTEPQYDDDIPF